MATRIVVTDVKRKAGPPMVLREFAKRHLIERQTSTDSEPEKKSTDERPLSSFENFAICDIINKNQVGDVTLVNLSSQHVMNDAIHQALTDSVSRSRMDDLTLDWTLSWKPMVKSTVISLKDGLKAILSQKLTNVCLIIANTSSAEAAESAYSASGFYCNAAHYLGRSRVLTAWVPGVVTIPRNVFTATEYSSHTFTFDEHWKTIAITFGQVTNDVFVSDHFSIVPGVGKVAKNVRTYLIGRPRINDISTILLTMQFMQKFCRNEGINAMSKHNLQLAAAVVTAKTVYHDSIS